MTETMGYEVEMKVSHHEAIARVTDALMTEGFGVLTRVDIDKAFRDKIGVAFRPYTILGTCNPELAHVALSAKPEIGLMHLLALGRIHQSHNTQTPRATRNLIGLSSVMVMESGNGRSWRNVA